MTREEGYSSLRPSRVVRKTRRPPTNPRPQAARLADPGHIGRQSSIWTNRCSGQGGLAAQGAATRGQRQALRARDSSQSHFADRPRLGHWAPEKTADSSSASGPSRTGLELWPDRAVSSCSQRLALAASGLARLTPLSNSGSSDDRCGTAKQTRGHIGRQSSIWTNRCSGQGGLAAQGGHSRPTPSAASTIETGALRPHDSRPCREAIRGRWHLKNRRSFQAPMAQPRPIGKVGLTAIACSLNMPHDRYQFRH